MDRQSEMGCGGAAIRGDGAAQLSLAVCDGQLPGGHRRETDPERRAYERGAKVLLLPTVPFGVDTNLLKIPGGLALSVNPSTLLKLLTDLVDSLSRQGIKKVMLLNGHGGNELKPLIRELHHTSDVFLCVCDWFRVGRDKFGEIFDRPGEHADELETSMGLAFFPGAGEAAQAGGEWRGASHALRGDAEGVGEHHAAVPS